MKKLGSRYRKLSWSYRGLDTLRLVAGFFRRYPLHDDRCIHKPLFIIGSGRSGNTLLRAILIAHGEFSIPPESYVLGTVIREYYRFNFLPWSVLARLVLSRFESHPQFAIWKLNIGALYQQALTLEPDQRNLACVLDLLYMYYLEEKQPGATRWGDKTPLNTLYLDEISLVFPYAKYVHLIRDGRDVVVSYVESGLYHDLENSAYRWSKSIYSAQRLGAQVGPDQYIEVRYETLVTCPEETIRTLCEFLCMTYKPEMLHFWKIVDQLDDIQLPHYSNVRNPINPNSIGKWKSHLSPLEQRQVQSWLGPILKNLGY